MGLSLADISGEVVRVHGCRLWGADLDSRYDCIGSEPAHQAENLNDNNQSSSDFQIYWKLTLKIERQVWRKL